MKKLITIFTFVCSIAFMHSCKAQDFSVRMGLGVDFQLFQINSRFGGHLTIPKFVGLGLELPVNEKLSAELYPTIYSASLEGSYGSVSINSPDLLHIEVPFGVKYYFSKAKFRPFIAVGGMLGIGLLKNNYKRILNSSNLVEYVEIDGKYKSNKAIVGGTIKFGLEVKRFVFSLGAKTDLANLVSNDKMRSRIGGEFSLGYKFYKK